MDGSPSTIRSVSGDNIECIEASLSAEGYKVDTILGRMDAGKPAMTGDQAAEELTKKLLANPYGVLYFLGHGAAINSLKPWVANFSPIAMGSIDRDRKEIKDVIKGRQLDRGVNDEIAKALTEQFGLTWDASNPPIFVGVERDGISNLWVRPAFFSQIRGKGTSFDSTLVMVNTCSSGANKSQAEAIKPKAYFGWKKTMSGELVSQAGETIFDSLRDKARTARAASQLWQIHELFVAKSEATARDERADPKSLVGIGVGGTAYVPITGQTHILIYHIRHAPGSAASDIQARAALVQSCYREVWQLGMRGGLKAPQCRPLEFGSAVPTEADVDDAQAEVGRPVNKPWGRWTLAD